MAEGLKVQNSQPYAESVFKLCIRRLQLPLYDMFEFLLGHVTAGGMAGPDA